MTHTHTRASFVFAVSDNSSAMSYTHDEVFGFGINLTGLLQLSARQTTVVNSRTTAESLERCTVRLVLGLPPRDHVSSALKELHGLPLHYHIQFKLAVVMFRAYVGQCPL